MYVISIVGMTGSGKSEVALMFREKGFISVRFGDVTDDELRRKALPLNEANERKVRESLRREHGMNAYAKLSLPRIEEGLKTSHVVVDGLYSWEEYLLLREYYTEQFRVVAVWSPPSTRYDRLGRRSIRPLTPADAASRDQAEIENLNKGGPICMADYTILNNGKLDDMRPQVERIIGELA